MRDAEDQIRKLNDQKNENAKTMKILEDKYEEFQGKLHHLVNENEKLKADNRMKDTEIAQLKAPKYVSQVKCLWFA